MTRTATCIDKKKSLKSVTICKKKQSVRRSQDLAGSREESISVQVKLSEALQNIKPSKNALQPSKEQAQYIESISPILKKMSLSEWTLIFDTDLYDKLFHKKANKIKDHENRANHIVSMVQKNPKINKIVLMDGHGRFIVTLCKILLKELGKKRANSLTLELIDNFTDSSGFPSVTAWHHNIEFDKMVSFQKSLFDQQIDKTTIVYANFCGIGGAKMVEKLFTWMDSSIMRTLYSHFQMSVAQRLLTTWSIQI